MGRGGLRTMSSLGSGGTQDPGFGSHARRRRPCPPGSSSGRCARWHRRSLLRRGTRTHSDLDRVLAATLEAHVVQIEHRAFWPVRTTRCRTRARSWRGPGPNLVRARADARRPSGCRGAREEMLARQRTDVRVADVTLEPARRVGFRAGMSVYPIRMMVCMDLAATGTEGAVIAPARPLCAVPDRDEGADPRRRADRSPTLRLAEPPERAADVLVPVPGVPGLYVRSALMGIEEACAVLGIPSTTLARMVTAGDVPHTRIGKHVRFAPGHIGAVILAGERPAQHAEARGSARTRL